MAARRLGLESDDALAKVRRVLPDRVRLGVESLEHTLGFTGELETAPPDGETLLAIAEADPPRPPRPGPLHGFRGRRHRPRAQPLRPRRPRRPLVRPRLRPRPRASRARCAPTASAPSASPAPPSPPRRASTRSPSSPARSPASPGPTRSRSSSTPTSPPPPAASHPPSPSSNPHGDHTLLRLRADSLDWAAGLLAAAGCDFTVRHPHALRTALRQPRPPPKRRLNGDCPL